MVPSRSQGSLERTGFLFDSAIVQRSQRLEMTIRSQTDMEASKVSDVVSYAALRAEGSTLATRDRAVVRAGEELSAASVRPLPLALLLS